jgi:hypothetical protein
MNYFDVDALSNSGISALARFMGGEPPFSVSAETLEFGSLFHTAVLEPHLYKNPDFLVDSMAGALMANTLFSYFNKHPHARREWEVYYRNKYTGVKAKAKFDLWIPGIAVVDLKTTSCASLSEFKTSIKAYNYHRQAAWYMDAKKTPAFYFFGVQKKYNPKIFMVKYKIDYPLIEEGRDEYIYIINKAKAKNLIAQ